MENEDRRIIKIEMPSQTIMLDAYVKQDGDYLEIDIVYTHPSTDRLRNARRQPYKNAFSQKHFEKELDAYIVQEAMSDLTDNRHVHDWVE